MRTGEDSDELKQIPPATPSPGPGRCLNVVLLLRTSVLSVPRLRCLLLWGRDALAALGMRAYAGESISQHELLLAALAAFRLELEDIAPLLTWASRCPT